MCNDSSLGSSGVVEDAISVKYMYSGTAIVVVVLASKTIFVRAEIIWPMVRNIFSWILWGIIGTWLWCVYNFDHKMYEVYLFLT